MKYNAFVEKYKIRPALSAGLRVHLRVSDDMEVGEDRFIAGYKEFAGKDLVTVKKQEKARPMEKVEIPKKKEGK